MDHTHTDRWVDGGSTYGRCVCEMLPCAASFGCAAAEGRRRSVARDLRSRVVLAPSSMRRGANGERVALFPVFTVSTEHKVKEE